MPRPSVTGYFDFTVAECMTNEDLYYQLKYPIINAIKNAVTTLSIRSRHQGTHLTEKGNDST